MFAINHAAAALVLKRGNPTVPLSWLLLSVQATELLWVVLNALGVERTRTDAVVHSVRDIHLAHMPFSHSLLGTLAVALLLGGLAGWRLRSRAAFVAVALGVGSHFVLDLATHARDLPVAPGLAAPLLGSGLYANAPLAAFALELAFGVACWWGYGGGWRLLAVIVAFNVANLPTFSAALAGPEALLTGRPELLVALVAVQIAVTLPLVGWLARGRVEVAGRVASRSVVVRGTGLLGQ